MDVNCPGIHRVVAAPDPFEQDVARENNMLVAREVEEQVELFRLQFERPVAPGGAVLGRVNPQWPRLERLRHARSIVCQRADNLAAAQQRLDARQQFAHRKGLGEVVIRAEFETQHLVQFALARGQPQNRHGQVAAGRSRRAEINAARPA
jgi:hypothetical protein